VWSAAGIDPVDGAVPDAVAVDAAANKSTTLRLAFYGKPFFVIEKPRKRKVFRVSIGCGIRIRTLTIRVRVVGMRGKPLYRHFRDFPLIQSIRLFRRNKNEKAKNHGEPQGKSTDNL
jgi:hypothetical protein